MDTSHNSRDVKASIKTKEDLFNEVKEVWGKLERGEQIKKLYSTILNSGPFEVDHENG